MTNTKPSNPRSVNSLRRWITCLAFLGAVLAFVPAAWAHAHPKVMLPTADSIGPSPAMVKITFSEALEPKFSTIKVVDAAGKPVTAATAEPVSGDATTLTLALPKLAAGPYVVEWVSVAVDGHRLAGQYKFTVK